MDAYRAASLHEIEKAMQGKRVVLVEESGGSLLIGFEPWTDEAGRVHCTALRITIFTDSDGEARFRIDYHDDRCWAANFPQMKIKRFLAAVNRSQREAVA